MGAPNANRAAQPLSLAQFPERDAGSVRIQLPHHIFVCQEQHHGRVNLTSCISPFTTDTSASSVATTLPCPMGSAAAMVRCWVLVSRRMLTV